MQREKRIKEIEYNRKELCDTYKRCKYMQWKRPEEGKNKGTEEMLEVIMAENLPKLIVGTKPQFQEAQRTSGEIINNNNNKNLHQSISY